MKNGASTLFYAAIAVAILCFASAVGFLQSRVVPQQQPRTTMGAKLSEQQIISRRRAAMNTAAIADTTVQ